MSNRRGRPKETVQPLEVDGEGRVSRARVIDCATGVKGSWRLIERHIAEVLANGNQEFEDYLKKWTAWKFQNPGLPPEAA